MWNIYLVFLLFNCLHIGNAAVKTVKDDADTTPDDSDWIPGSDGMGNFVIVGGHDINITAVPYQVTILYNGSYYCGGSIIRSDVVVSAAHCVTGLDVSKVQIRAGSSYNSSGGVVVAASRLLYYPEYTFGAKDGDISLVWLATPLQLGDTIQPVPLAAAGQGLPAGAMTFVSGWGYITPNGPFATYLQGVSVPIVSHDECNEDYRGKITSKMLCAGYKAGGKDACTYDSGSPLVYKGTLYGVVSWGRGCAQPYYPGVYAKVSELSAWVNSVIRVAETEKH